MMGDDSKPSQGFTRQDARRGGEVEGGVSPEVEPQQICMQEEAGSLGDGRVQGRRRQRKPGALET